MKRRTHQPVNRRRAFTLLEVLMVIVIIGILAAAVVPSFFRVGEDAKIDLARATINTGLNGILDLYQLQMGRYPESLEQLVERPDDEIEGEKWRGPYVKDAKSLRDPWGNEWIYEYPGTYNEESYDLSSSGKNARAGDEDDVTNWEKA